MHRQHLPLPFDQCELAAAFVAWLEDGPDAPGGILARLHLPGTRRRVLNHLRDRQLVAAAVLLQPHGGDYARAVGLRAACQAFSLYQWPAWRKLPAPPEGAKPVAEVLFWAFRYNDGNTRENRPHTPADWSLSAFRKLTQNTRKECVDQQAA